MASYTGSGNKSVSSAYLFSTLQTFYTNIKTLLAGKSDTTHTHSAPALTSCTGTLTVAKGGTGATTATKALTNLGITYGTAALTPGTSTLTTGSIYFQYE